MPSYFYIDILDGHGPGRGKPGANGDAGHAGQGGLLFEDDAKFIFGDIYGVKPDIHLIGGSAGKYQRIFKTSMPF